MNAEDYYRAVDIENVKGETIPAGRELNNDEMAKLMDVCEEDKTIAGARDGAIIALMYSCGLRRAEVVNLDLEDYDPTSGKIKVMGKRRKERTAYLVNEAAIAMKDWLNVRGDWEGSLFFSPFISNFGKPTYEIIHRRMTTQGIYNVLAKRAKQAGVSRL